jgi:hypothetical protein
MNEAGAERASGGIPRVVMGVFLLLLGGASWLGVRAILKSRIVPPPPLRANLHIPGAAIHLERGNVSAFPLAKLYATFVDGEGRVVTGLGKDNFRLLFDGKEVVAADLKPISQTGEPTYLAIVAPVAVDSDLLERVRGGIRTVAAAAATMPRSKVALITYGAETRRRAELSDPGSLDAAVSAMFPETPEGARLGDPVRAAIDLLNAPGVPDNAPKLIVVLADGRASRADDPNELDALGRKARLANIVVDAVVFLPPAAPALEGPARMVQAASGTLRTAKDAAAFSAQLTRVGVELTDEYVMLFQSPYRGEGKEHTYQLSSLVDGRPLLSNPIVQICEDHDDRF